MAALRPRRAFGTAPAVTLAAVPRLWPDSTIVCIGTGPSLTAEDVDYCRNRAKVIAINDAYRLAPWADVLYACDARWWAWHKGVTTFTGLKFALQPRASCWPNVQVLKNTGETGIESDPGGVRTGRNSGYQAMNVAVHLGARRIVLLGYDMGMDGKKSHWFGDHPDKTESPYALMAKNFTTLVDPLRALQIDVVNCSRRTALTAFPKGVLAQVLP